jgi:hypothetical protein
MFWAVLNEPPPPFIPSESTDLAAEHETIIQMIAWDLFDARAKVTAEFPGPTDISDARRGDIDDMLRGFRQMTENEQRRVGHLARNWRAIGDRRDAAPGPRTMRLRLTVDGATEQLLSRGLKAGQPRS